MTSVQQRRVTVIMPAFNEAQTIGAQLQALARQSEITPEEIIVADNGSTDGTLEVVAAHVGALPQLRFIVADSVKGPSHARNEAARVASGDVLAFCDSDDEVDDRWLVELVAALEHADVVTGALDLSRLNSARVRAWRDIDKTSEPGVVKAVTSNMAMDRASFVDLGMFDESFEWGHDHEFSYRAQARGLRVRFAPRAVVHYRIKSEVRSLARRTYQDQVGAAHVFARYGPTIVERAPLAVVLKNWGWLLLHVFELGNRRLAPRWIRKAAGALGRVRGSIRYRVRYL